MSSGWVQRTLDQLAVYHNGRAFKPSDWTETGLPIIRIAQITNPNAVPNYYDGNVDGKQVIVNGDLLFSWSATLAVLKWNRGPAILNQHIFKVMENEGVSRDFLRHLLLHSLPGLAERSHGSTMKHIRKGVLREHHVSVPPLPEQHKIAAILSSVDDAIEKTQAVIDQVQVVKRGLMQELLTRGLPGRHTRFKQTEIGEIPEEWDVLRLLDVASLRSGQVDPTKEPYRNWPLISPNHVESTTGHLLRVETASEQQAISGKYLFEPGDVVYCKIRPYLEKATVATFRGLCSADMYPLRPGPRIESRFLLSSLLSQRFTDFAKSVSMRTGIPKINREELGRFLLAVPPSVEQLRIVLVVESLDRRCKVESSRKEKLANMKSALMSVLLTGELRVTPDPETI